MRSPARLAAAAMMAAAPVAAQETQPTTVLRTLVVTPAAGVEQQAFDAPASVNVIEGSVLRQGQLGINLSESLVRVPGIVALNRQNYAQDIQVSSRGFGARSTFGVRGLRLFADGIPATAPDGQGQVSHFDLASAARVEVLRGPFSALYGNSSGGVISITTADGGPDTVGEVSTAFGSDDIRRFNARASGAAGNWKVNASGTRFSTGGWRDHSAAQRTGLNAKFRYTAGPGTRATFVLNAIDMPNVQDPLGLTRAEMEANPRQASPAALAFNTRKSVRQSQAGMVLEHALDAVHALKLTAWGGTRGTVQFQAIPVGTQAPATHPGGVIDLDRSYGGADLQWVMKTRLAGAPFTLTAGLATDTLGETRRGYQNFAGAVLGVQGALRRDEDNRVRSFDQYLQGVWTGERFSITAGLRHSQVAFRSRDHYIVPGNGDDSGSVDFSAVTPALGVTWHASDDTNVYASLGRGFETPTFNELSYRPGGPGLNFALRPADSRQWELGAKSALAPGWQGTVALFQARTRDEIVVLSNTGGRSTFQNAGRTKRHGIEALVEGRFNDAWSLLLAATWLDARYATDFLTCVAAPCAAPNTPVAAGSRIPGIPRATVFAELGWRHKPWGLETALEVRHTGSIAVDDRNTDAAPAATVVNLRALWTQHVGRWTFRESVRIDNVANRRTVGSVIVNEGSRRFFEPAPGRSWLAGMDATYAF
jgi:iron complex outermembrane receptor protein